MFTIVLCISFLFLDVAIVWNITTMYSRNRLVVEQQIHRQRQQHEKRSVKYKKKVLIKRSN